MNYSQVIASGLIRPKKARYTRKDAEQDLNEIGTPEDDKRSNGGRIPDHAKYGSWMRRNDPIAFNLYHQDTKRELAHRNRSAN